ncbi:diacylglycerol kinase family protein [Streptacidiphilus sp. MAP5-3]|uniref:diacylglycerol/lipid kinase family protein n=1 Tax=unclassified Streptacidiphilus TaxID=2643834 RepID=UPI0035176917
MSDADGRRLTRARALARLALLCAAGAVAVLLAVVGHHGVLVPLVGLLGLALAAGGAWWALAHRGLRRLGGALVALGAPVAVLVVYAVTGLLLAGFGALLLWGAALTSARSALRQVRRPGRMHAQRTARPQRPVLIMNPRSGGGKVARFGLAEKAERLGARVVLLEPSAEDGRPVDVSALARQAVADGADLLGVAGGDGTQALVAAVAAEHDLPFLVVSAGTRNHFAMDLGLDRADPSRCLDALSDGEEFCVDLGAVAGHPFVNTVSFGAYAEIVQSPAYREAKAGTVLDALPELLLGDPEGRLRARADGRRLDGQQALLVSNNPYSGGDPLTGGRRPRLDRGLLGVLGIRVDGPAQAAEVALLGVRASGLSALTAREVVVHADVPVIAVAVDGEALRMTPPVTCTVRPGVLRVRVPVHRPGAPVTSPPLDWRRIVALALGRPLPQPRAHPAPPAAGVPESEGTQEPSTPEEDTRG